MADWFLLIGLVCALGWGACCRWLELAALRQRDEALAELELRDLRGYTGSDEQ